MRPLAMLFPLLLQSAAPASPPGVPAPTVLTWAGPEGVQAGFTEAQALAFLEARKADLAAGKQEPWAGWLKGLAAVDNPSLRAWAMTRQLEAGEYGALGALEGFIVSHVPGLAKAGAGPAPILNPPWHPRLHLPSTLVVDPASPFWKALANTLHRSPDMALDSGLYALWTFGTDPGQRGLILELAAHVKTPVTQANPSPDPWNDPRFWIVMDWALAWGGEADFKALEEALPEGNARTVFARTRAAMGRIPLFFAQAPETPDPAKALPKPLVGDVVDFDFAQIKVIFQPPPPRYPAEARSRRLTVNITVDIIVSATGEPVFCRPVPGPWLAFFAPTAVEYASRWRFVPLMLNGKPQVARFRLNMPFRLR